MSTYVWSMMLPQASNTVGFQNVAALAEVVFMTQAGKHMQLRLDNCHNAKTLACFCLDLLLRGVILLYGGANGVVQLDRLSMTEFEHVSGLMRNAGIVVRLLRDDSCDEPPSTPVDLTELNGAPDDCRDLEAYRVYLRPSHTTKLTLWFSLIRVLM